MELTSARTSFSVFMRHHRYDILIGVILSAAFFLGSYQMAKAVPSVITDYSAYDNWYESDAPKVYENMTNRESDHGRIKAHPLFVLFTHPIVYLMKKLFGFSPAIAVRLLIGFIAFVWMFALFLIFRIMGCHRFDAISFCALAAVSSASMFWFTVPETFSFGSLSILLALLIVPLSKDRMLSPLWYILINVLTFSFVITNWMAGIFATITTNSFKRAIHIVVYSFALVTVLWGIQKHIYPDATFFIGEPIDYWNFTISSQKSGNPLNVLTSFYYHTLIMPAAQIGLDQYMVAPAMLTQLCKPGSGSTPWGIWAVILWTFLLLLGIHATFSLKKYFALRVVLVLMLLGQLTLHLLYGDETFLYSLHFIVLLVPMVALSSLTRMRTAVIMLTLLLIPCVFINNITQFNKTVNFFKFRGATTDQH